MKRLFILSFILVRAMIIDGNVNIAKMEALGKALQTLVDIGYPQNGPLKIHQAIVDDGYVYLAVEFDT